MTIEHKNDWLCPVLARLTLVDYIVHGLLTKDRSDAHLVFAAFAFAKIFVAAHTDGRTREPEANDVLEHAHLPIFARVWVARISAVVHFFGRIVDVDQAFLSQRGLERAPRFLRRLHCNGNIVPSKHTLLENAPFFTLSRMIDIVPRALMTKRALFIPPNTIDLIQPKQHGNCSWI